MLRLPPRPTRTATVLPYATRFRSLVVSAADLGRPRQVADIPLELLHLGPARVGARRRDDGSLRRGRGECQRQQRGGERKAQRSEEHTSELQSLMRISYAVFCLKNKNDNKPPNINQTRE